MMNCLMVLEHGKFPLEAQTPRSVNHPPRRRRDTDTSAGTCTGINLLRCCGIDLLSRLIEA